jgi:hypothetical protein
VFSRLSSEVFFYISFLDKHRLLLLLLAHLENYRLERSKESRRREGRSTIFSIRSLESGEFAVLAIGPDAALTPLTAQHTTSRKRMAQIGLGGSEHIGPAFDALLAALTPYPALRNFGFSNSGSGSSSSCSGYPTSSVPS